MDDIIKRRWIRFSSLLYYINTDNVHELRRTAPSELFHDIHYAWKCQINMTRNTRSPACCPHLLIHTLIPHNPFRQVLHKTPLTPITMTLNLWYQGSWWLVSLKPKHDHLWAMYTWNDLLDRLAGYLYLPLLLFMVGLGSGRGGVLCTVTKAQQIQQLWSILWIWQPKVLIINREM